MKLPIAERLQLIDTLLESVPRTGEMPFDSEWIEVARDRLDRINSGASRLIPWEEVRANARRAALSSHE